MDASRIYILLVIFCPVLAQSWKYDSVGHKVREPYKDSHYLTKRHMRSKETETKKRLTTPRQRNKPTGHLSTLPEEDVENDVTASIAIDPPPNQLKQEKVIRKKYQKPVETSTAPNEIVPAKPTINESLSYSAAATELVKNVLSELGKEFITHEANEDFVFGQYVGRAMRNLTNEYRIKMQHEVLELVVKYQKLNRGDIFEEREREPKNIDVVLKKIERKSQNGNETDDGWTDFSNLANIVV